MVASSATKLVLGHDVEPQDDGSILVGSITDPLKAYHLVGTTCTCQDFERGQAPEGWCQHRIAAGIQKRVEQLGLGAQDHLDTQPAAPAPEAVSPADGIDPRHIVLIQQAVRKICRVAGAGAPARLAESGGHVYYNDPELALAQATAVFPFGAFTDVGDASPGNTNQKVRAHFRRVAATRASARVLRLALNINMVALEELADE